MTNLSAQQADHADLEDYIARQIAGMATPDRASLGAYLRANPGHSMRDWKGKSIGHLFGATPGEPDWASLRPDTVRIEATAAPARYLSRPMRQAAARNKALVWNPLARKYRLRVPGDPLPAA